MTYKEALDSLKFEVYEEGHCSYIEEELDLAIKALEKQVPKKPTYVDTRFRNHGKSIADGVSLSKCYKCPNCSTHIFHVFDSETHCNHCGQALDWE